MSLFVSYCHRQSPWVHRRLVPVLRASGATLLVDVDKFAAGQTVIGQMNELQDSADYHVLVLTGDYLASDYCQHEMARAIAADPGFAKILPIRRDGTPLPPGLAGTNGLGSEPLYVDLKDDTDSAPWELLLRGADLTLRGTDAPSWLRALDQTATHLKRGECVNLLVREKVDWRAWREQFIVTRFPDLGVVDLDNPSTIPREGLVEEILRKTSGPPSRPVPAPPHDLPALAEGLRNGGRHHVLFNHFDRINDDGRNYGDALAQTLRFLTMDDRCLAFIAQTRAPVATMLPANDVHSWPEFKTVELG